MQHEPMPIKETMPMTETCCEPRGSTPIDATEPIGDASSQRSQKLAVVGGILGAIAASSCCILPLALFSLGISGAWIGNLTQLAPYQPYFMAATVACLGYGYWLVYRSRQIACADSQVCVRPLPNRLVMSGLILATVLVTGALAFDLLAPLFLKS
jgi:mercuric ion transport protein